MPLSTELFNEFCEMKILDHMIGWDRKKTGQNLKKLRDSNPNLARYVCKYSRLYKIHNTRPDALLPDVPCPYAYSCSDCNEFHKRLDGSNDVSTRILSREKELSIWRADQISAMEKGRYLTLEKVFFYAFLSQVPISEILVLSNGYIFNEDGIIIRNNNNLQGE